MSLCLYIALVAAAKRNTMLSPVSPTLKTDGDGGIDGGMTVGAVVERDERGLDEMDAAPLRPLRPFSSMPCGPSGA